MRYEIFFSFVIFIPIDWSNENMRILINFISLPSSSSQENKKTKNQLTFLPILRLHLNQLLDLCLTKRMKL